MTLELAGASAVVVAHQFNPSVMSEVWLARYELLVEEEKEFGCVFTDAIVNVRSRRFNLLVTPDQLQFAPKVEPELQRELILEKLAGIVDLLPHIPYHAVGLNFVWTLRPQNESLQEVTRRLFYLADRPIFRHFDTGDAQFGTYLSKEALGCRLKLDIKPVVGPAVNMAFNFHLDVAGEEKAPNRMRQFFGQWDDAKQEAERIVRDVEDVQ